MATTITKTYTEDTLSSYKATWTFNFTGEETPDPITVSDDTFDLHIPPAPTAKYVYSGKNMGGANALLAVKNANGETVGSGAWRYPASGYPYAVSWANNTAKSLLQSTSSGDTKFKGTTSKLFNENNRDSLTAPIYYFIYSVDGVSCKSELGNQENSFYSEAEFSLGTVQTVTLDAPPILSDATLTSSSRNGIFWTADSAGNANSRLVITPLKTQYKAWFSSFRVYLDDTLIYSYGSYNGTSARIQPSINSSISAGTYTPKLVVTDTRGQTTTREFDPITIQQYVRATYDITQVQSDTASFFANKSTASVTISNISCPTGVVLEKAKLTIGNDVIEQELDGTETTITLSVPLTATGTFTPDVYITDSRGLGEHNYLNPITVYSYAQPTANIEAQRITSLANPVADDEGQNVLITANISFADSISISEPTVTVGTDTANVTWYETYTGSALSNAIDWNNYTPTSPVTIYGFSDGYGAITGYNTGDAFQITVSVEDSTTATAQVTVSVPQAFFTIDFLAGGHGIAFGKLSENEGFECAMDATFESTAEFSSTVNIHGDFTCSEDVFLELPGYQTGGTTDKAIYDAVVALGWNSDVLIS